MKKDSINIYVICIVLLIMNCSYSLFTLTLLKGLLSVLCILTLLSFFFFFKERTSITKEVLVFYIFIGLGQFISLRGDVFNLILSFIGRLPILTLFMLKYEYLQNVTKNIVKCFYIIISASLLLYLLNIFHVPIPSMGIVEYNQYQLNNFYYIYTDSLTYEGRFTGFCLETGYFSLLCICLLAVEGFDFSKKSSKIFLLSLLLSVSLEGYLLLVIGIVITSLSKAKRLSDSSLRIIGLFTLFAVLLFIITNYNGGNNIIAQKILERLGFDEDLGIVGNNRENIYAQAIVDELFYSNDIWFGIGSELLASALDFEEVNICSWRVFVLSHGAIYTLIFFFLILLFFNRTVKRKTITIFMVLLLDFYPHGDLFDETLYFYIIICLLNLKKSLNFEFGLNKI